jgi:pyrroline-5-carboxylate reductase
VAETAIGIVGGGRIARILLGGWVRAGVSLPRVVVSDASADALTRLTTEFPFIETTPDNRLAAGQPLVLFALHPPAFAAALSELRDSLTPDAVFVSLAPVWSMSRIGEALGGFARLARAIPNAPSIVNEGYNPVSFSPGVAAGDRACVLALLAPLGACPEVPEESLEAYAILAAMGPTYLWYQLYQLIDLGTQFGLSRDAAAAAVAAMVTGASATMTGSGLPPEGVMDLVPVKPLASIEPSVKEAYVSALGALHKKLKG